jgi:hypothetical protein
MGVNRQCAEILKFLAEHLAHSAQDGIARSTCF